MNYEQKYKEALNRAKSVYGENPVDSERSKACQIIFPELAESEDERIRKMLIERVRNANELNEELREWIIAYFEKQKEQPKEELVYRLNGLMQEYIKEGKDEEEKEHRFKCYQLFWDALEDADFFKKEQKPVEESIKESTPNLVDEQKKNLQDIKEKC